MSETTGSTVEAETQHLLREEERILGAVNLIARRHPAEGEPVIGYQEALAGAQFGGLWAEKYVANAAGLDLKRDPATDRQAMLYAQQEAAELLETSGDKTIDLSSEAVMIAAKDAFCFRFGPEAGAISKVLDWSLEPYAGTLPMPTQRAD